MALSLQQRQERHRARKRQAGQQRHHVWLYPHEWRELQITLNLIVARRSATIARKTEETA